ncbi:MAG TPA: hypothetical protein VGV14_17855, partial [Rhodanobacter sp.]|nr:hypothetical protein [Rhodanobacter sp.]
MSSSDAAINPKARKCRASVCLAELFRLFPRATNPSNLEMQVFARRPVVDEDKKQHFSSTFQKWETRASKPRPTTIDAVAHRIKERKTEADGPLDNRLEEWADSPIWRLISLPCNVDSTDIAAALFELDPVTQGALFYPSRNVEKLPVRRRGYRVPLALEKMGTWNAFL